MKRYLSHNIHNYFLQWNFDEKSWFAIFFSRVKLMKKYANQLFKSRFLCGTYFFTLKCEKTKDLVRAFHHCVEIFYMQPTFVNLLLMHHWSQPTTRWPKVAESAGWVSKKNAVPKNTEFIIRVSLKLHYYLTQHLWKMFCQKVQIFGWEFP